MAEFLTTKDITSRIDQIIREARGELVLISPYFQLSDQFYARLCQASERGVDITIVFGKARLDDEEFYAFVDLPTVDLLYCHNLHAKCYFNEQKLVIASMNFYAYSEYNNYEMGVYVERQSNATFYDSAYQEAMTIINEAELVKKSQKKELEWSPKGNDDGHCIRCNCAVPLDVERPLCKSCFMTWDKFGNLDFEENFCHNCGSQAFTSMRKPECSSCYSTNTYNRYY